MPTVEGWAWIAWATENNGFSSVELLEPGYLEQEAELHREPCRLGHKG